MAFLTKQEKYVIVFLIIGAVCGLSYSYYKKFRPPINLNFKERPRQEVIQNLDTLLTEEKSVNINQASIEELIKLNGIGPVLAHRIIEYRRKNGPFKDKDKINEVTGIGPKKYEAIKDYIVTE
jgi:comEA protein